MKEVGGIFCACLIGFKPEELKSVVSNNLQKCFCLITLKEVVEINNRALEKKLSKVIRQC